MNDGGWENRIEIVRPEDIEKRSFEIIREELTAMGITLPEEEDKIIRRCIHTSADFDYARTLKFSENAAAICRKLIINGANIITDTNMAKAGINEKKLSAFGGKVYCFMADPDVAREAKERGVTRATVSMERAAKLPGKKIFAVGNAPTALIKLHELITNGSFRPDFIIGVPVGFVNVEAAKELIMRADVPYIVNAGRKGGSNIAAAICNALLYDLRYGFTTGSCAAAASKAAAYMLLSGHEKKRITIETPKGIPYETEILDIKRDEASVSCAVKKYAGDDPDITDGMLIYARVSYIDELSDVTSEDNTCDVTDDELPDATSGDELSDATSGNELSDVKIDVGTRNVAQKENGIADKQEIEVTGTGCQNEHIGIKITGGEGIGRVTLPGLDQPVGEYAINHVPREMITKEVSEVSEVFDNKRGLLVEISAPEGRKAAEKTFNPRLGIVDGISILGTSGIVEPMSEKAILDTIRAELSVHRAQGEEKIVVSPGNYGLDFIKKHYDYDLNKAVKCSNFIGDTVKAADEMGFRSFILIGHIGKLVKLAGGMLNTHSKYGDNRMQVIAEEAHKAGAPEEVCNEIMQCISTDAAIEILKRYDADTYDQERRLEDSAMSGHDVDGVDDACYKRGLLTHVMNNICHRIIDVLREIISDEMKLSVVMFSNVYGLLAETYEDDKIDNN